MARLQSGFTLIELVVVIALLGILSAVALPRFIDISSDAQAASVESLAGSLATSLQLVMARKLIDGDPNSVTLAGEAVGLEAGYPEASANNVRAMLRTELPDSQWTDNWNSQACQGSSFCIVGRLNAGQANTSNITGFNSGTGVFIWPRGYTLGSCFAYYINPADGSAPLLGADTQGC